METKNELLTMSINQNTNAKELYKFIKQNMIFDEVIELYRLLKTKVEDLEDDLEFKLDEFEISELVEKVEE